MLRKAIGAIIHQEGRFLLLSRKAIMLKDGTFEAIPEEWDLLKGGVEDGEDAQEALSRELFEETGSQSYAVERQFPQPLRYGLPAKTGFTKQEVTMFLVRYTGDDSDLKPDAEEVSEVRFFARDQAISQITYPETRDYFSLHAP